MSPFQINQSVLSAFGEQYPICGVQVEYDFRADQDPHMMYVWVYLNSGKGRESVFVSSPYSETGLSTLEFQAMMYRLAVEISSKVSHMEQLGTDV